MEETKTAISQQSPNSPEVRTIASAQPSSTHTNVSLVSASASQVNLGQEDENVVVMPHPIAANIRFSVSLAALITQGLAIWLCQMFVFSPNALIHYLGVFMTLFVGFFTVEWIRIHSFALTRQKRAFFDEKNILDTYQPRARTHGHLFKPDPPTPGPIVKIAEDAELPERSANEKKAFSALRDAHYENMYEHAAKMAKEAEEADRRALEEQKARLAANGGAEAGAAAVGADGLPKGEPLYEDFSGSNAPTDGPPADLGGTRLELPPSILQRMNEDEITPPRQPSSGKSGKFFEDFASGNSSTASSTVSTAAATTTSSDSQASTPTAATSTASSTTATATKSGQKRRKNKNTNNDQRI